MNYLELFLSFFKIGAFTFGGGYAMISMIRETVLAHGWMTEGELLNFVAVAESTPGPIAVNMATFVGASQGGILGALAATFGVVLPSFLIILVIAALISNLLKYPCVNAVLAGIRPCIVAMILATAVTVGMSVFFGFSAMGDPITPDWKGVAIFAALLILHFAYQRISKKKPSPILMILLSAGVGIVLYS